MTSDLIARLSKLDGPDREIDGAIHNGLFGTAYVLAGRSPTGFRDPYNGDGYPIVPRYTASVDAAIALAERVLPGWTIARLGQDDNKRWNAELRQGHLTAYDRVTLGGAPNAAIALVIAILRAKEAGHG